MKVKRQTLLMTFGLGVIGISLYLTLYEKRLIETVSFRVDRRYVGTRETQNNCSEEISKVSFKILPNTQTVFGRESDSCMKSKKVRWRMLIIIKSPLRNIDRRRLIRRTWGRVKFVQGGQFSILFVTGNTSRIKPQKDIETESEKYGDILQVNKKDDYKNLIYKTLGGMQWVYENLPDNYLYSTTDDDMFINIGDVQEIIDKNIRTMNEKNWPEFPIVCMHKRWKWTLPQRSTNNKNYISKEDYKWPMWPTFCAGGMYTTSSAVLKSLYKLALSNYPIATDDVWITGILRHKLGFPTVMLTKPSKFPTYHYGSLHDVKFDGMKYWKNISKNLNKKDVCISDA